MISMMTSSFTSTSLFYTQLVGVSNHYLRPSYGVRVLGGLCDYEGRGGEGRAQLLGLGQDFFSKPNTVADFSLFFNIRLSILCKNLFFQSLQCLKDSFLNPSPQIKKQVGLL